MGWYATTGEPYVRHLKRSDYFSNLRKEALGIHIHEYLWDYILDAPLDAGLTVTGVFKALADRVREFPQRVPAAPCSSEYFARLAQAMKVWAGLFESTQA